MADGDRFVVIASKAGAPSHPDWYHNLAANSEVNVEVGAEQFPALATIAEEPERSALYDKMAAQYAIFAGYKEKTSRVIPVIVLTRRP